MVSTIGDEYRLTIFPLSCPYDEAIKMVKDTGSLNHFAALSLSITYLTSMIVLQRKRRKYDMVMPHLGSVATGIFSDHRIRFMLHSQILPDSYGRSPILRVSPWRANCQNVQTRQ